MSSNHILGFDWFFRDGEEEKEGGKGKMEV
jgi:hypothetical protein